MNYKKNYIENFIFRIDYQEISQDIIEDIVNQMKTDFINVLDGLKSREVINNIIKMDEETNIAEISDRRKNIEYRLFNKDNNEFITITNQFICYEKEKYDGFEKAKIIIDKINGKLQFIEVDHAKD